MAYLWQFYLLIGIILIQGLFLAFGSKHGRVFFLWLCFVELTLIAGLRAWNIGSDTHNYVALFIGAIHHVNISFSYMEKGYVLYNKILALFTSDPQAILMANAFIITGSILQFIRKYSVSVLLPVLLFVIWQFAGTLCIMRQYMALAVILLSIPFVIKRQLLPFVLSCIIATSFHTSAILALGLYFLYPLPFKYKYMLGIFIGTIFGFLFLAPLLDRILPIIGRYDGYVGGILLGEETKIASIMKTLLHTAIFIFLLVSYRYIYIYMEREKEYPLVHYLSHFCFGAVLCPFVYNLSQSEELLWKG